MWLRPPSADVAVPAGWCDRPLDDPAVTAAQAAAVAVHESAEPLVPVPVATFVPYDRLTLPPRGPLIVRQGVAERLAAVAAALPEPFGLVVLDAWRSPGYQAALLAHYRDAIPGLRAGFVADAADGPTPPHTTGGAVDLTLAWAGEPLALGTDFDAFTDDARPAAAERTGDSGAAQVRDLRRMLATAMTGQGFAVHPLEWWHWSYGEQWWAAASGRPGCPYGAVVEP